MSRISGRTPEVRVEYDVRNERRTKFFEGAFKARSFYVRKDREGRNPKVLRSDTMATAETKNDVETTEVSKPVKKVPPTKKKLPAVKTKRPAKKAPVKSTKKTAPAKKSTKAVKKTAATKAKAKKSTTKKAPVKKKTSGDADITPNQFLALKALAGERKGIRRSELPDVAGFDKTQTGKIIGYTNPEINAREVHAGNLQNRKLVEQGQEEVDEKNVWMVHITPKGREVFKANKKHFA